MELTKNQIRAAGVKYIDLAAALGISAPMVSQIPDDVPLADKYQYALRFGSKEAKSIRRKTIKHLKKNENL